MILTLLGRSHFARRAFILLLRKLVKQQCWYFNNNRNIVYINIWIILAMYLFFRYKGVTLISMLCKYINGREYWRSNQKSIIQRNRQHNVHRTKINNTKTQHNVHRTKINNTKVQHNVCWSPLYTNKTQIM